MGEADINDWLFFLGTACIIGGCYLIAPALALVAVGALLMATGLARMAEPGQPGNGSEDLREAAVRRL
jgi:hypothetical protein